MVRRKIEIKPLDDRSKRHTTFTKRRSGLAKKTEEFCRKYDSTGVVITFSKAGNCYVLAHPHVDTVLGQYEAKYASALPVEAEISTRSPAVERVVHGGGEAAPLTEVHRRIAIALKVGRWEEALAGLGIQELNELYAEVESIKRKMVLREWKTAAADRSETGEGLTSGTTTA